ncbi:MAG: hypothetical protein ACPG32_02350 [Akkermansiaceae bacterium]
MSYPSIDTLQKTLADTVFSHTKDRKKAAGRALGTLVEIVNYYLLRSWGFRNSIAIERRLSEYNNAIITHNVEYSLHPILQSEQFCIEEPKLPLSTAKLKKTLPAGIYGFQTSSLKNFQLLASNLTLRNSCTLADDPNKGILMSHLESYSSSRAQIEIDVLHPQPWAIFECKRVGVEDGMKKGPQTIEKAKQGAYVARTISSLQKIRLPDGKLGGLIYNENGEPEIGEHSILIDRIVNSDSDKTLQQFALSVGLVSNHGNWFSSDNKNKELEVLAASYDWLVFLSDRGLTEFIQELLLDPKPLLKPARNAFLSSYSKEKKKNCFTKVQMNLEADAVLQKYFEHHKEKIHNWFNVISPHNENLTTLQQQLAELRDKNWATIHETQS